MALVVLSLVEQRLDAVRAVLAGASVTEVAASIGVSRQSVHGWLARYLVHPRSMVGFQPLTLCGRRALFLPRLRPGCHLTRALFDYAATTRQLASASRAASRRRVASLQPSQGRLVRLGP